MRCYAQDMDQIIQTVVVMAIQVVRLFVKTTVIVLSGARTSHTPFALLGSIITYRAEASMVSMSRLFIACVAGASALKVAEEEKRVLVLGCSLDRNAIMEFMWTHGTNTEQTSEPMQAGWGFQKDFNVRMGYIWHPGVGLHGDLHAPFALGRCKSTGSIVSKFANETSQYMLQGTPDLVVVDSSLWDLLVWRLGTGGENTTWGEPKEVTEERVQQWCQKDVPYLLGNVSRAFPTSRIAFRTAPTIDHTPKYEKFEKRDIELLYKCISSNTKKGKLFGKYEVIDYHAIMNKLIDRKIPHLFNGDGYHPSSYASALYIKELLSRVGLNIPAPPEPQLDQQQRLKPLIPISGAAARAAADQDGPNFQDLM